MTKLRVLHVINKISPSGGAEVSLVQLLPCLAERGVAQGLVTLVPNTAPQLIVALQATGVRTWQTGGGSVARAVPALVRAVRDFQPDVIASTLYEANRAARLAGALTGTPVLCAVVNDPYGAQARAAAVSPWKLRLVAGVEGALSRRLTSGLHALTEASAQDAVRRLRVRRSSITVVPRGRSQTQLAPLTPERRRQVRDSLGLSQHDLVILNVGRHEAQKGQLLLVRAFEDVADAVPHAVLLVAGRPGAASGALAARVQASPFRDRIRLLGLRNDVPDLLGAADVFAFSSLWEGLGGAVLEALGAGVAVAAFAVPAVVEVLGDAGRVAPVADAQALGKVLLELAQQPAQRSELAARGRLRFAERYELDAVVPAMEQLYRSAARLPPPGRRRASR